MQLSLGPSAPAGLVQRVRIVLWAANGGPLHFRSLLDSLDLDLDEH